DEVEHGRGINRYTQRPVGGGIDFSGRQAAEVGQTLAQATTDRHHQFDVTQTVLVADQVRATLGQLFQQIGVEAADVAVVDHHTDVHRLAHLLDVSGNTFLGRFGQVVRQQQQALGA